MLVNGIYEKDHPDVLTLLREEAIWPKIQTYDLIMSFCFQVIFKKKNRKSKTYFSVHTL